MFQRPDVDDFLDEVHPAQLAEWQAYCAFVGADSWRQTAIIAQSVHALACTIVNALGGKSTLPDFEEFMLPLVRDIEQTEGGAMDALQKHLTALAKAKGIA